MFDVKNRMEGDGAKKRGRPTKAEAQDRPFAQPSPDVPVPVTGCICPCCGRGMVPKVIRSNSSGSNNRCTLCGKLFRRFRSGMEWLARPE